MSYKLPSREHQQLRILRKAAFHKQAGLCYWCQKPMKENAEQGDPLMLTGDHLIPLHAGGMTVPGNIVAACRQCNSGRHPELNQVPGGRQAISVGEETGDRWPWLDKLRQWGRERGLIDEGSA